MRRIDSNLVKKLYVQYLEKTKSGYRSDWNKIVSDYEKITGEKFAKSSLRNHTKGLDLEEEYRKKMARKPKDVKKEVIVEDGVINSELKSKTELKNTVIQNMKELGVYRPEFEDVIDIYTNMLHRLNLLYEQFEATGFQVESEYTNKAGATNFRKTPLYAAIEKLENDIVTYSDRLCLNPKSVQNMINEQPQMSKFDEVLLKLEERYND